MSFEEQAHGRPLAPGVDAFLDLLLDDVELDLLVGERMIGGGGPLLLDHRAAALQQLFELRSSSSDCVESASQSCSSRPIVSAARSGAKSASVPCLPMAAAISRVAAARFFRSSSASSSSAASCRKLLLVGDAAFLEQRFAAAAVADRGLGVLDHFDLERLGPLADRFALLDTRCCCWRYSASR